MSITHLLLSLLFFSSLLPKQSAVGEPLRQKEIIFKARGIVIPKDLFVAELVK